MGRDNEFSSIALSPSILKWHKMSKEFVAHGGNRLRKSAELPHCCLGELSPAREEVREVREVRGRWEGESLPADSTLQCYC